MVTLTGRQGGGQDVVAQEAGVLIALMRRTGTAGVARSWGDRAMYSSPSLISVLLAFFGVRIG